MQMLEDRINNKLTYAVDGMKQTFKKFLNKTNLDTSGSKFEDCVTDPHNDASSTKKGTRKKKQTSTARLKRHIDGSKGKSQTSATHTGGKRVSS